MEFERMTIAEIVLWLEQRTDEITSADLRSLRQDIRAGVRQAAARWEKRQADVIAERERLSRLWGEERSLWQSGYRFIAGVDEAGRGPLAGPVVAAAVVFPHEVQIVGMNDSKRLTASRREELCEQILLQARAVSIAAIDHYSIDRINILEATRQAMRLAVEGLGDDVDFVLVDGNALPSWKLPGRALIKGDGRSFSIAAASIVAKVFRDRLMTAYDQVYPQYGFARHKGYPCSEHYRALLQYGPCRIHRLSFLRKFAEGIADDQHK